MDSTLIILIIGLVAGGIAFLVMKMGKKKTDDKNKNGKKGEEEAITDGTVKRKTGKEIPRKNVIDFMEFDRIVDNMILQENESKYTMVLQCKGINYDLMSDIEQLAIEEGFIVFLNTLKFPVQLYVQARAIDLKKSMNIYQESVDEIINKFNAADENYKALINEIDVDFNRVAAAKEERDRFANILEYAQDITRYVERISLNKNILQRRFYIVFSYYKSEVTSVSEFTKEEIHEICHRELFTRAQSIMSALMSCSVTSKILDSNELAELLFVSYNRDDEKLLDIRTALESGFYRLYSTSQDIYEKKEELIQKEVADEAAKRVQEAIRQTLRSAVVKSEEQIVEEFEEKTDRQALEIIRNADIDEDSKKKLTNIIAENHVKGVEERKQERAQKSLKKQEVLEETNEEDEKINIENNQMEDEPVLANNETPSSNMSRNYLDIEVNNEESNSDEEEDEKKENQDNNIIMDSSEDDIIV
ncbi:MAG: hypothetical protein Q4D02_07855 [Clostridia bacterium]|nr:hypothetical protein [Clostridia bacterium]